MSVLPILPRGFVVGRILTSRGDQADADKFPDTAVVVGLVDFTPATAYRKLDAATVVTHSKFTAKLDSHGDLHPQREASDNTGSDAEDGIWLPVGTWAVAYRLNTGFGALPEHYIEVTTAHTEAAPLPLFANLGDPAPAGATFVQLSVPLGGQQGQVLVMTDGSLSWGNVSGGGGGIDTEGVQDIVGNMVTGAGGTYDDVAGTITLPSGGGGGAVSSVAGRTGAVVLSSADLTDGASLATDVELAEGLSGKADAMHSHTSAQIADFTEATQDIVGGMIVGAGGTYDDTSGTIALPAAVRVEMVNDFASITSPEPGVLYLRIEP